MRRVKMICGVIGFLLALTAWAHAGDVRVSVAVSMKEAATEAAKGFEAATGDHVLLTFGASGQLAAQIENGAPVDAFISAANKQVNDLEKAGLIEAGTRRVVARNALVLIVPGDAKDGPSGFAALGDEGVGRVAIGEPKTVPAGQYAIEVLKAVGVADKLGGRLIYGTNVRQVLDYVERGEVGAGIVYSTDAKEAGAGVKAVATAEETWHEPIVYPGAVIKGAADAAGGKAFLDYMGSEAGKAALIAHGFLAGGEAKSGGAGAKSDDAGAKSGGAEAGNVDAPSSRPSP